MSLEEAIKSPTLSWMLKILQEKKKMMITIEKVKEISMGSTLPRPKATIKNKIGSIYTFPMELKDPTLYIIKPTSITTTVA